jgi:hypothetical protein
VDIVYSEGRAAQGCEQHAEHLLANPTGPLMDRLRIDGPRRTPYFGLEPYVHMQLLNAPFRTMNLTEADLVYVPFYVTMLSYSYRASGCFPVYTKAEEAAIVTAFWDMADELLPALSQKPHWLALAQLEADVSNGCGSDWGVAFLCDSRSAHFIFTVPEPLAEYEDWLHRFASPVKLHSNMVAVPYFGHMHGMVRGVPAAQEVMGLKSALVAMSFGPHRHESLRSKLMAHCHDRAGSCVFVGLDRAAGEVQQNIPDVLHAYAASWFCAQPGGDTPLRRGLYDCLALGHVLPVLFDERAIDHLPFAELIDYKGFVTILGGVGAPGNAIDVLANATSITERIRMIAALQRVAGVFQYAVNPAYSVVRFEAMNVVEHADDAFTASFKAVLRNACSRMLLPAAGCSSPAKLKAIP